MQKFRHAGKDPHWFHYECFFEMYRPKSTNDIDQLKSIKYEDQQKICEKVESFSLKKRKADADVCATLKDFGVEYSASDVQCVCCSKIMEGDIRIKKIVYDTEVGRQTLWHHSGCFARIRGDYGFYPGADQLPGFSDLSAENQDYLNIVIP